MNNAYGAVYEIVGFSALTTEAVKQFDHVFLETFLKKGAVAGRISSEGWLRVHVDRNSEYPDLDLEISAEGRLLVCDMDVHKADLLEHLRGFLHSFQELSLVKLLEAANGDNVSKVL
jgi:hypothetical protein